MKYWILPLRTPDGAIFSWLLFCSNGDIYAESKFSDAVIRMDNHADYVTGGRQHVEV